MAARLWLFEALDTLFFRDGTPFNMGETDSRGIRSTFPPGMPTLQGAIRTALAVGQGWHKGSEWPEETLGSYDGIGSLALQGPYLAAVTAGKLNLLFPFPAAAVRHQGGFAYLFPDEASVATDLMAATRLTKELDFEDIQGTAGLWLTAKGLEAVLSGNQPEKGDWYDSNSLWSYENRVGITIDRRTGTVEQGGLYSLAHIRPAANLRIAVIVSGVEDAWHQAIPKTIPLGGESRMAIVSTQEVSDFLPAPPILTPCSGKAHFTVTLVTPGHFGLLNPSEQGNFEQVRKDVREVIRTGPLQGFGDCVSACIPKLSQIGGWDIVNRRPRPLRPEIIPGSTWFYKADASRSEEIIALHGSHVGSDTEYGYGQILIGRWG
jgi:CRISPR-associated protein Cmr3